jgi:hypothetical protein
VRDKNLGLAVDTADLLSGTSQAIGSRPASLQSKLFRISVGLMMIYRRSLPLLLALVACTATHAFVVKKAPLGAGETRLHLLPTQGNQLIAASTVVYDEESTGGSAVAAPRDHGDANRSARETAKRSMATAARSLVNAVVQSTLPHAAKENDEVLFPLNGFTLIRDKPDHYRVLPTAANPSCRLPSCSRDEILYGWFSPACPLDTFAHDDETYAAHPRQKHAPVSELNP